MRTRNPLLVSICLCSLLLGLGWLLAAQPLLAATRQEVQLTATPTPTATRTPSTAELRISKSGSPNPAAAGQPLVFTIVVTNVGPGPAQNVLIKDVLPTGINFSGQSQIAVSNGTGANLSLSSKILTGTVTTLNVGGVVNITGRTVVAANTSGSLLNTASAQAANATLQQATALISVVTATSTPTVSPTATSTLAPTSTSTPSSAVLQIRKSGSPNPVAAGQALVFTIVVTNVGPGPAQNVVINDVLPAGVSFSGQSQISVASGVGAFLSASGNVMTGTITTLNVGGVATITASTLVNANASGNSLLNTASARAANATLQQATALVNLVVATNTATPTSTPTKTATPTQTPTNTATATPTATPAPTNPGDLIFADDFESGNLSSWSARAIGGGDLSVVVTNGMVNSKALQAVINDNVLMYVTDDSPNAELRYRARFYFDPNSMGMAPADTHLIFYGYQGTTPAVLRLELRFYNGFYQVRSGLLDDSALWKLTPWYTIGDTLHFLELDWQAATAPGANNGSLTFWLDGVAKPSLTGIDNDTRRIDRVRLGAVASLDTGTRGVYFFDAFVAHRQSYIGPAAGNQLQTTPDPSDRTTPLTTFTTQVNTNTTTTVYGATAGLNLTLTAAQGALTDAQSLVMAEQEVATAPAGYEVVGNGFTVQALDAQGTPLLAFQQPLTLTIDLSTLIIDPGSAPMLAVRWNEMTQTWEPLPMVTPTMPGMLVVTVANPSTILLVRPEADEEVMVNPVYLPLMRW